MGKKRKKRSFVRTDNMFMWVFLIMIVFFIAITQYSDIIGLDPQIGITLTDLFPTLFLSCIGIYLVSTANKVGKFGGMISLGLGLCLYLDQADAQGLIAAEMLSGLTVLQTQIWVMVLSIIFGAVFFSKR